MAEVRDHQKTIKKAIEEAIKAIDRDHQLSKGMVIACVLLRPGSCGKHCTMNGAEAKEQASHPPEMLRMHDGSREDRNTDKSCIPALTVEVSGVGMTANDLSASWARSPSLVRRLSTLTFVVAGIGMAANESSTTWTRSPSLARRLSWRPWPLLAIFTCLSSLAKEFARRTSLSLYFRYCHPAVDVLDHRRSLFEQRVLPRAG